MRTKNKTTKHVRAPGGKGVRLFYFDNFIRLTKLPPGDELRGGGKIGGCALDRLLLDTLLNQSNLFGRQAEVVGKTQIPWLPQAGRDETREKYCRDLAGAGP